MKVFGRFSFAIFAASFLVTPNIAAAHDDNDEGKSAVPSLRGGTMDTPTLSDSDFDDNVDDSAGAHRMLQSSCSATRCGTNWSDAYNKCGTTCAAWPNPGWDACPSGESCFANLRTDLSCCSAAPPPSPTQGTCSATRCGVNWSDAYNKCGTTCAAWPNPGWDACPSGESCFANLRTDLSCCSSSGGGGTSSGGGGTGTGSCNKIVGGYLPNWLGSGTTPPQNINSEYNLLYLFAARHQGSGRISYIPPSGYPRNYYNDVQAARAQGRKVILSVGGQNSGFNLNSRSESNNFINSFVSIYNTVGGLDGLDWNNYESNVIPSTNEMIYVSRELKRRYGSGFLITTPPAAWRQADKDHCRAMVNAGALDYAAPQWYDSDHRKQELPTFMRQVGEWVNLVGQENLVIGLGVREGVYAYWTPSQAREAMQQVLANYPRIRGAFQWEAEWDADHGYGFANQVAPLLC